MRNLRQTGLTLIELMIGLAVIAIVISGIMVLASKVMSKAKISNAAKDIIYMLSKTKETYQGTVYDNNINLQNAISLNIVPEHLVTAPNAAQHQWGARINVYFFAGTGNTHGIRIEYFNVPVNVCAELVRSTWNYAKNIFLNNTWLKNTSSSAINVLQVQNLCNTTNRRMIWLTY